MGRGPVRSSRDLTFFRSIPAESAWRRRPVGMGWAAPWWARRGGLFQEFHFIKPQRTLNSPATRKMEIWGNERPWSPSWSQAAVLGVHLPRGQLASSGDPPPRPQDECQQAGRGQAWVGGGCPQGRELPACLWFSPESILGQNGGLHGTPHGLLVENLRAVSALSSEKLGVTHCPRG